MKNINLIDELFKTPGLNKLHDALCVGGLNSSPDGLPVVGSLPGRHIEHYLVRACCYCKVLMGYSQCDENNAGDVSHGMCAGCRRREEIKRLIGTEGDKKLRLRGEYEEKTKGG